MNAYVSTADYTPNQDKAPKYTPVVEIEYRDDVEKTDADFSGFGY
jgi:hypothetical protein